MSPRPDIPRESVAEFCRSHGIRRLALFGSVVRDDFRLDSDIHVLVEFNPQASVGLFTLAAMELELSQILGRKVDLRTPAELSRYLRDEVVESADVLFSV
jgi:uncharacterized protein